MNRICFLFVMAIIVFCSCKSPLYQAHEKVDEIRFSYKIDEKQKMLVNKLSQLRALDSCRIPNLVVYEPEKIIYFGNCMGAVVSTKLDSLIVTGFYSPNLNNGAWAIYVNQMTYSGEDSIKSYIRTYILARE